jgi:serine phosphatase RsbU (regulator of sigma subunit)
MPRSAAAIGFAALGLGAIARLHASEHAAREAQGRLETFVDRAPVGLAFFDPELRFARVNESMAAMNRRPAAEHAGRRAVEVLGSPAGPWVEAHLRDVLASGEPLLDAELVGPQLADGRARRHFRVSFYPVRDARDEILGVGVSVEDVSDRWREESDLRLLARTGAVLESAVDADERLERLARLLVPGFAEGCVVELLDRGRLRTAAVAHRDPGAEDALRSMRDAAGLSRVVRDGSTERTPDRIAVPLLARDRVLGALSLSRGPDQPRFDDTDVTVVEEVAARAALAVDNALLLARQTEIARTLQQSLLPPHLPAIPGVELAARYRSASAGVDVGGDFYDAFPTRGGWTLTIGDACGKGPAAATVTALARHTIRALAFERATPGEVLRGVNDRLSRQPDGEALLTAALVKLAPTGEGFHVTVACAGHPPPLVVRTSGSVEELGRPGTLLGPFAREAVFVDVSTVLETGDALVLYTDGVTDVRRDGVLFGESHLRDVLSASAGRGAHRMADAVDRALEQFGGSSSDDMALLVAGVAQPRVRQ